MKVLAFSDLHLFARRSKGETYLPTIQKMAEDVSHIVICGDLFDFRWSESKDMQSAVLRGVLWLERLLELLPDTPITYVLGNHDGIEEFPPHLEALEARFEYFQWRGDYLVLGATLFLHGDIPMKSYGKMLGPRPYKVGENIKNGLLNSLYDLITVTRSVNLYRKSVDANRKLPFILSAVKATDSMSHVKRVVFGHSHHAFDERIVDGYDCINLGSGVVGYRFNPVILEV